MPPGLHITAIIAAYNEADIIAQTVGDLVRQGIAAHVLDQHSTEVDRLVLSAQAEEAVALAAQDVHVHFHDLDPLHEEDPLGEGHPEPDPPDAGGTARRL